MPSLAGSFLIAKASMKDPTFAQTVILLLAHNDEGAFGIVVNRPVKTKDLPFPLFFGGPCDSPGLVLLHGHADLAEGASEPEEEAGGVQGEVAPGIFVGDASCLERLTDPPGDEAPRIRLFRGYAGWAPGQLEQELTVGAWAIASASGEVLFDTPPDKLWDQLLPPFFPEPSLN